MSKYYEYNEALNILYHGCHKKCIRCKSKWKGYCEKEKAFDLLSELIEKYRSEESIKEHSCFAEVNKNE